MKETIKTISYGNKLVQALVVPGTVSWSPNGGFVTYKTEIYSKAQPVLTKDIVGLNSHFIPLRLRLNTINDGVNEGVSVEYTVKLARPYTEDLDFIYVISEALCGRH